VADPVAAGVGINPNDPLDHPKNMVGIGTLVPVGELLEMAKKMNPRLKRVGLPWNPSQANSEVYTLMARDKAAKMGLELLEGTVDATPAVGEVVASLAARGADLILTAGDLTVTVAMDAVIAECRRAGIPAFATQLPWRPKARCWPWAPTTTGSGAKRATLPRVSLPARI